MPGRIVAGIAEPSEQDVREHLVRVLGSPYFRNARRCQDFLRFIVEQTLQGNAENLRERTIGVEVFGRSTYEPSEETVVRVTATDVRKRLAQYYQEAAHETLHIGLIPGTYTPRFTRPVPQEVPPEATPARDFEPTLPTAPPKPLRSRRIGWLLLGLGLIAVALVSRWALSDRTPLTEFWQPVLSAPRPALVWIGSGSGYLLSARIKDQLAHASKDQPLQLTVGPNEMILVNQQVSAGHVRGLLNIMLLLQRFGKPGEYRFDDPIAISELAGRPIILVGSFNNRWAMSLNSQFRFQFGRIEKPDGQVLLSVEDTQHPGTRWLLPPVRSINDASYDYAIITRMFYPETRQVLITAGGMFHFGTEAAAEFITNPVYWLELARKAPRGWQQKNIQVVLKSDVLRGSPSRPQIIATNFW